MLPIIEVGIQRGAKIHNQDQVMKPDSFNIKNDKKINIGKSKSISPILIFVI